MLAFILFFIFLSTGNSNEIYKYTLKESKHVSLHLEEENYLNVSGETGSDNKTDRFQNFKGQKRNVEKNLPQIPTSQIRSQDPNLGYFFSKNDQEKKTINSATIDLYIAINNTDHTKKASGYSSIIPKISRQLLSKFSNSQRKNKKKNLAKLASTLKRKYSFEQKEVPWYYDLEFTTRSSEYILDVLEQNGDKLNSPTTIADILTDEPASSKHRTSNSEIVKSETILQHASKKSENLFSKILLQPHQVFKYVSKRSLGGSKSSVAEIPNVKPFSSFFTIPKSLALNKSFGYSLNNGRYFSSFNSFSSIKQSPKPVHKSKKISDSNATAASSSTARSTTSEKLTYLVKNHDGQITKPNVKISINKNISKDTSLVKNELTNVNAINASDNHVTNTNDLEYSDHDLDYYTTVASDYENIFLADDYSGVTTTKANTETTQSSLVEQAEIYLKPTASAHSNQQIYNNNRKTSVEGQNDPSAISQETDKVNFELTTASFDSSESNQHSPLDKVPPSFFSIPKNIQLSQSSQFSLKGNRYFSSFSSISNRPKDKKLSSTGNYFKKPALGFPSSTNFKSSTLIPEHNRAGVVTERTKSLQNFNQWKENSSPTSIYSSNLPTISNIDPVSVNKSITFHDSIKVNNTTQKNIRSQADILSSSRQESKMRLSEINLLSLPSNVLQLITNQNFNQPETFSPTYVSPTLKTPTLASKSLSPTLSSVFSEHDVDNSIQYKKNKTWYSPGNETKIDDFTKKNHLHKLVTKAALKSSFLRNYVENTHNLTSKSTDQLASLAVTSSSDDYYLFQDYTTDGNDYKGGNQWNDEFIGKVKLSESTTAITPTELKTVTTSATKITSRTIKSPYSFFAIPKDIETPGSLKYLLQGNRYFSNIGPTSKTTVVKKSTQLSAIPTVHSISNKNTPHIVEDLIHVLPNSRQNPEILAEDISKQNNFKLSKENFQPTSLTTLSAATTTSSLLSGINLFNLPTHIRQLVLEQNRRALTNSNTAPPNTSVRITTESTLENTKPPVRLITDQPILTTILSSITTTTTPKKYFENTEKPITTVRQALNKPPNSFFSIPKNLKLSNSLQFSLQGNRYFSNIITNQGSFLTTEKTITSSRNFGQSSTLPKNTNKFLPTNFFSNNPIKSNTPATSVSTLATPLSGENSIKAITVSKNFYHTKKTLLERIAEKKNENAGKSLEAPTEPYNHYFDNDYTADTTDAGEIEDFINSVETTTATYSETSSNLVSKLTSLKTSTAILSNNKATSNQALTADNFPNKDVGRSVLFVDDQLSKDESFSTVSTIKYLFTPSENDAFTENDVLLRSFHNFEANWKWILLIGLGVIVVFCIPGMLIQIYCFKFYQAYKRERNRKEEGKPKLIKSKKISIDDCDDRERSNSLDYEPENRNADQRSRGSRESLQSSYSINSINSQSSKGSEKSEENFITNELPEQNLPIDCSDLHHRVDIYSGPPTLNFPSAPPLPEKLSQSRSISSNSNKIFPPELPPKSSQLLPPQEFSLHAQVNASDEDFSSSYNDLQRLSITHKPPILPPKPKQYRIRPFVDNRFKENQAKYKKDKQQRQEKYSTRKHDRTTKKASAQINSKKRNPEEKQKANNEKLRRKKNDYDRKRHADKPKSAKKEKQKNESNTKLEQLKRQEALLREIIQGIAEAEMLQTKLAQTRKLTSEKRKSAKRLKSKKRNVTSDNKIKAKKIKKESGRGKHRDDPPSYEHVVITD